MKHTLIACALVVAGGFSAAGFAAQHNDAESMHARHLDRMALELELSAEQKEKIGTLNGTYAERYRELSQAHRQEVRNLLNEEQQARMQQMRKERHEKMSEHHARHADGKHRAHADRDN